MTESDRHSGIKRPSYNKELSFFVVLWKKVQAKVDKQADLKAEKEMKRIKR